MLICSSSTRQTSPGGVSSALTSNRSLGDGARGARGRTVHGCDGSHRLQRARRHPSPPSVSGSVPSLQDPVQPGEAACASSERSRNPAGEQAQVPVDLLTAVTQHSIGRWPWRATEGRRAAAANLLISAADLKLISSR